MKAVGRSAIVDAFVEYADVVSRALGDRVRHWITFNEPWVSAFNGYANGNHAPGLHDHDAALAASHHLLLSHGRSVPVIRQNSPGSDVGITLNLTPMHPASPSIADKKLATWKDGLINRWFLDPLAGRGYPQDMVESYNSDLPFLQPGDYDEIIAPIDFLGVNFYTREIARAADISEEDNEPIELVRGDEITEMNWEVYPPALYEMLGRLHFEYRVPAIYITENGAAFPDTVSPDGQVYDPARLSYFKRHLEMTHKAIQIGVPVKGYFAWSLMDNFEWAHGYKMRFGIVHVDFETQERTPKQSALWFRDVIHQNRVSE